MRMITIAENNMTQTESQAVNKLKSSAINLKAMLEKFSEDIVTDPINALKWADSQVATAAEKMATEYMIHVIEVHGLENAIEVGIERLLNETAYATLSTSQNSNLMDHYSRSSLARLVLELSRLMPPQ